MLDLLRTLTTRLAVPVAAISLGAFFAQGVEQPEPLAEGRCSTFAGTSVGNDPTQTTTFQLCRAGHTIVGTKVSQGAAGRTAFTLAGTIDDAGWITLHITDTILDEPAIGWVTCTDDRITLRWDDDTGALRGEYFSAACRDHAVLGLWPVSPARGGLSHRCRH